VNDVKAHPHAKRTKDQLSKVHGALSVLNNVASSSREHKVLLVDVGVPALLPSCLELEHGDEAFTQNVRAPSLAFLLASMHYLYVVTLQPKDVLHAMSSPKGVTRDKRVRLSGLFTFERG
jgi:hypothetical protein